MAHFFTTIDNDQSNPDIAIDKNGNFIIVWQSKYQEKVKYRSDRGFGIFAQRFDKDGIPIGNEFQVNTQINKDQKYPSIAIDSKGYFIIVWQSKDGSGLGIFAQRFDNNAMPINMEFQINSSFINNQLYPSISMNLKGNFVISWQSVFSNLRFDIFAQKFSSDGAFLDNEFQVNTYTQLDQSNPDVIMDKNGNFIITWQSDKQDGSKNGIFARIFKNQ